MTNSATATLRSFNPAYLVLVLLPWLVLVIDSSWIYNTASGIDQWVYVGYFFDYPRYVTHFYPELYYGTRLPWILPGYLLHQLFDPVTARYLLHVGFYYFAAFSLYSFLQKAVGQRAALLAAVLFGTHSYFLSAIGWDYVDGPGLTYNVVALACVAKAATSRRHWSWLMAGGAAAMAMFYCNAFLIVFFPFLPALYIYQTHQGLSRATLHAAPRFFLRFTAGALLVTLILGTVSYAVGAGFWFYEPSFDFILKSSSKPNPLFQGGWTWTERAIWLAFPIMVAIGSIAYLALHLRLRTMRARDLRLFLVLHYLSCLGIMTAWHMAGGNGLEASYYTSYLLPSAFLALGSIIATPFERWRAFSYWILLAIVLVGFVARPLAVPGRVSSLVYAAGWFAVAVCIGFTIILNVLWRGRWQALLLFLAGLWLYQTDPLLPFFKRGQHSKETFLRVMDSLKLIRLHTGTDPLRFWYTTQERYGNEFIAINSIYLWSWAIVSPEFPAIWPQHSLSPGVEGVILSSAGDVLAPADRALSLLRLQARSLKTETVSRDGISYRLYFFRTEPLGMRAEEVPLGLSAVQGSAPEFLLSPAADATPLQRERWQFVTSPEGDGRLEPEPDGLHIVTPPQRFGFATAYAPLTAGRTGFYHFVLEYADLHGGFQFGCFSAKEKNLVAQSAPAIGHGIKGVREAYVELHAGEKVIPVVANYSYYGAGHRSSLVLKSFRAYAAFDQ